MSTTITIHGKALQVRWTYAAARALAKRSTPLLAEMELYFSCLIRKRVRFKEPTPADGAVAVNEHLSVSFRPVMTQHCGLDFEGDEPPLTDFPIARPDAFVPRWLRIDYQNGQWSGEYGYEE